MAQQPITLSIFFPAYNEEDNLRPTVEKTVRVVEESPYINDYEILIIDDGSRDRTATVARTLEAHYPNVRLIQHERNMGYGEALKTGIRCATMDYVFFTDADLQFDILELQNLLVHIPQSDAVIGYRAPRRDPLLRLLNAWGWNKLNRLLFNLRVADIDCAFKLFRRRQVQSLPLRSHGAMISAEVLVRLQRVGARIKEVPVSHLPRMWGVATGAKLSVIIRALREMAGLYWSDLGSVTHKQALRFGMVGVLNTLVDVMGYLFLTRTSGLLTGEPTAAKFFSFMLGTVTSLYLNRYWTFGVAGPLRAGEVARFYTTVSVALLLNVSLMYVLVHSVHMHDLVAFAVATGASLLVNFTLSRLWVFSPTLAPRH